MNDDGAEMAARHGEGVILSSSSGTSPLRPRRPRRRLASAFGSPSSIFLLLTVAACWFLSLDATLRFHLQQHVGQDDGAYDNLPPSLGGASMDAAGGKRVPPTWRVEYRWDGRKNARLRDERYDFAEAMLGSREGRGKYLYQHPVMSNKGGGSSTEPW